MDVVPYSAIIGSCIFLSSASLFVVHIGIFRAVQFWMASFYLVLNSAFVTWVFQHTQAQANQVFEKSAIVTINVPLFAGDGDDNIISRCW